MAKPKTQVKTAVKAKTGASPAEAVGRPEDKVRMATKESDDMKKLSRVQARESATKEPLKTAMETLEDNGETVVNGADLSAHAPARVNEIARAVMAAKEPGLLNGKIARAKATREGKPGQAKDPEKTSAASQDIEARRMRLKNLIVQGKERGYLT